MDLAWSITCDFCRKAEDFSENHFLRGRIEAAAEEEGDDVLVEEGDFLCRLSISIAAVGAIDGWKENPPESLMK